MVQSGWHSKISIPFIHPRLELTGISFLYLRHAFTMNQKEIDELLAAEVITEETAGSIAAYYRSREDASPNRLLIVFGILGAILVGLGIILIIAHNWDQFPISVKSAFAFLPLLIGQAFCAYTLVVKPRADAWREGSAVFTFFGIGACIALISQIYNIQGELYSFLFTWMLLGAPLIYVMRSSMASLLFIAGSTYYAVTLGYFAFDRTAPWYFLLLMVAVPHYYLLSTRRPDSNFTFFHHWVVPLSLIIALGTIGSGSEEFLMVAYMSMLGIFYGIGQTAWVSTEKIRRNSYKILGSLGTVVLLLITSFEWYWDFLKSEVALSTEFRSPEFFVAIILTLLAIFVFARNLKSRFDLERIKPVEPVFLVFALTFMLGYFSGFSVVIVNILVFAVGLLTIREGARIDNLGVLNYGLLVIAALVICRFFDTDLSFVVKGLLFLVVGVGFFFANYRLIKSRREDDQ